MAEYKLLTLRQIAELLEINERDVGQLLRDGYLPGYKLGRGWRVSLAEINAFICKHGKVSPDELRSGNGANGSNAANGPNGANGTNGANGFNGANGSNGVQLQRDAPRPSKRRPSVVAMKSNGRTEEIHSVQAQCKKESNWVPPWRQDE